MRPLRLDFPGAYHHITNRGRNKQRVFLDAADFELFLHYLALAARIHKVEVLAYALMGNHYHLVVRSAAGELSEFMQLLGSRYTLDFNERHDLDGALFKGRFFSKLIDTEAYLMESIRYVVNNPVKAGLVSAPEDYEMSSYPATIGLVPKPQFMASATFERSFNSDPDVFASFVNRADTPQADLFAHLMSSEISAQLVSTAIAQITTNMRSLEELPLRSDALRAFRKELLRFVCESCGVRIHQIADPQSPGAVEARLMLMTLLRHHNLSPASAIADAFGLSTSGMRSAISRFTQRAEQDPTLGGVLHAGRSLQAA